MGLCRGVFTFAATNESKPAVQMPRACPAEFHVRCYKRIKNPQSRCHGLAPRSFTFAATNESKPAVQMPRACPVEFHVRCYKRIKNPQSRCHGLAPWSFHVIRYTPTQKFRFGCHGLAPWSFTIAATNDQKPAVQMPRACPVEFSRSPLETIQNPSNQDATGLPRGVFTFAAT
jgi:hypothetical protein